MNGLKVMLVYKIGFFLLLLLGTCSKMYFFICLLFNADTIVRYSIIFYKMVYTNNLILEEVNANIIRGDSRSLL